MINLPAHTHTQHKPDATTHTFTTPHGTWTITQTGSLIAAIIGKITLIDGPGTHIRLETATDERINALLELFGAIPVSVVEAHIEDDETVVAFDPAAKPGDEPVVVARTAAGYMWRGQPKAMETLEREWATYEPKPRPPADRCTCVGECKNCRADKLGETFASWDEYEPYLIGGIKAHLVDWGIDWHAPKATFVNPFEELCANIATVMARYIRDTFDLDSLEKRDWTPPKDDPTSVDEFFTARYHPVRVRVSGAYDPPGAWLSTTRSNYGAHLSVDEVRRTILALARAAKLSDIAERIVHYNATMMPGDVAVPLTSLRNLTTLAEQMNVPPEILDMPVGYHFGDWLNPTPPDATLTAEPKEEPQ